MSGYGYPTLAERAVKMLEKANEYDRLGQIDPLNNLKNQRVYFYSGSADYVVRPSNTTFSSPNNRILIKFLIKQTLPF